MKGKAIDYIAEERAEESSSLEALPEWIETLFACPDESLSEAIKNLETSSAKSLHLQLAHIEAALSVLEERSRSFSAEYQELLVNATGLHSRLAPFPADSPAHWAPLLELLQNSNQSHSIARSQLRKVCSEWRKIEKERQETVSGSVLLIGRLWELLQVPESERFTLNTSDISIPALQRLESERKRLIDFQQARFRELYDSHVSELLKLMDALNWSAKRKQQLLAQHELYTAEGLQFISRQLAILQPRLELSKTLLESIKTRSEFIQKMRDFEKSASDPARLFRPSFQLLQEEKFRKTALPTLLNLEAKLQSKLREYHDAFGEEFCDAEGRPFVCVLEEEIAARYLNEGIFGFDRNREVRIKDTKETSDSQPRYAAAKARKLPSVGSANLPQRRSSSKMQ